MLHDSARIEGRAQVGNEAIPFVIRELSIQLDRSSDSKWKSENCTRRSIRPVDPSRCLMHCFGSYPHVAPDIRQLGQGQTLRCRQRTAARLLGLSCVFENLGDFFFAESTLGHSVDGPISDFIIREMYYLADLRAESSLYLKQVVMWSFTIPTACMNA